MNEEEPVTPMGRLCLQPDHNHIIHCSIEFKNPIDVDALKQELHNSIMIKIPRFSCILSVDPRDGSERWKKVNVNLDNHLIVHYHSSSSRGRSGDPDQDLDSDPSQLLLHGSSNEDAINEYLADMAISTPMRMDRPLWELHVMHEQQCVIMRVHHAIADGVSLMSLLWTMGRNPNHDRIQNNNDNNEKCVRKMSIWKRIANFWHTILFGTILVLRCLWVKDKGNVISGFGGMEFWPREVATAKFKIRDMKIIKKAIPNATVHDVLCGIIWCGLTRYLNVQYPDLLDGVQITGMCPYNLRQEAGIQDVRTMLRKSTRAPWGNRFSIILLPFIYYKKKCLNPLNYVALAKDIMDNKKQSLEALLSYNVISLASSLFGSKVAGFFYYNLFCNTSFLLSNIAGPSELIFIGDNPVTSIKVTSSSQPHAMTMHMVGYGEWANLQIQVAKDVIPDPKFLAQCFEDALLDMKNAAEGINNSKKS